MTTLSWLREPMALLVSLPRNDPALARAALDAGADGLKVHVGVRHRASGTLFGSLDEELPALRRILDDAAGRPVGIVPGDQPALPEELPGRLRRLGFAFLSIYADHLPAAWLAAPPLPLIPSVRPETPPAEGRALAELGVPALELGLIPPDGYGRPLTASDVARYAAWTRATGVPCVVPSQRAIRPADVAPLRRAGVRALLIGAVVTGLDADALGRATREFRRALDAGARAAGAGGEDR